jgi:hypothetical protein
MRRRKVRGSAIALMTIAGGLTMASTPGAAAERHGKAGFPCNGIRSSRVGVMNCNGRTRKANPNGNARTKQGFVVCDARSRQGVMKCNAREGFLKCNALTERPLGDGRSQR